MKDRKRRFAPAGEATCNRKGNIQGVAVVAVDKWVKQRKKKMDENKEGRLTWNASLLSPIEKDHLPRDKKPEEERKKKAMREGEKKKYRKKKYWMHNRIKSESAGHEYGKLTYLSTLIWGSALFRFFFSNARKMYNPEWFTIFRGCSKVSEIW